MTESLIPQFSSAPIDPEELLAAQAKPDLASLEPVFEDGTSQAPQTPKEVEKQPSAPRQPGRIRQAITKVREGREAKRLEEREYYKEFGTVALRLARGENVLLTNKVDKDGNVIEKNPLVPTSKLERRINLMLTAEADEIVKKHRRGMVKTEIKPGIAGGRESVQETRKKRRELTDAAYAKFNQGQIDTKALQKELRLAEMAVGFKGVATEKTVDTERSRAIAKLQAKIEKKAGSSIVLPPVENEATKSGSGTDNNEIKERVFSPEIITAATSILARADEELEKLKASKEVRVPTRATTTSIDRVVQVLIHNHINASGPKERDEYVKMYDDLTASMQQLKLEGETAKPEPKEPSGGSLEEDIAVVIPKVEIIPPVARPKKHHGPVVRPQGPATVTAEPVQSAAPENPKGRAIPELFQPLFEADALRSLSAEIEHSIEAEKELIPTGVKLGRSEIAKLTADARDKVIADRITDLDPKAPKYLRAELYKAVKRLREADKSAQRAQTTPAN